MCVSVNSYAIMQCRPKYSVIAVFVMIMCLFFCFPFLFNTIGVNNCDKALDSVPNNVIAHVRAEGGGTSVVYVSKTTWEWCGVMVPVFLDFWRAYCMFLLGTKTSC